MKNFVFTLLQLLLAFTLLTALSGCGNKDEGQKQESRSHAFAGRVVAVDLPSKQIVIAHGDIPDFMKAMTMSFVVKDTSILVGIGEGDSVRGVVMVRKPEVWLDSLALVVTPQ